MINETREQLLTILHLAKNEERARFYISLLLERFEYDLERKEKDLKRQLQKNNENMELLEYVKNEIFGSEK